jgi:hypothetical protein
MSADQLQLKIGQSRVQKPVTWYVNSSEQNANEFMSLVASVLKASKTEEVESVDPGIYENRLSLLPSTQFARD